jgi:hypothetical protein
VALSIARNQKTRATGYKGLERGKTGMNMWNVRGTCKLKPYVDQVNSSQLLAAWPGNKSAL